VLLTSWGLGCRSDSDGGETGTSGAGGDGAAGQGTTNSDTGSSDTSAGGTSTGSGTDGEDTTTTGTAGTNGGTTDTGTGGTSGAATCEEIPGAVQAELDAVASCEAGDSCEHNFVGSGCTDSPLPCCGFANRVGADLSTLRELNDSYMDQSCAGDALACCACLMPPPAVCVDGVCILRQPGAG
jgi:hypothetical protein